MSYNYAHEKCKKVAYENAYLHMEIFEKDAYDYFQPSFISDGWRYLGRVDSDHYHLLWFVSDDIVSCKKSDCFMPKKHLLISINFQVINSVH